MPTKKCGNLDASRWPGKQADGPPDVWCETGGKHTTGMRADVCGRGRVSSPCGGGRVNSTPVSELEESTGHGENLETNSKTQQLLT